MPNEATIVAASLDKTELENSINELVKNFDAKLAQMMKDTDVAVSTIENTFKRLRNVSFDSSGASNDNGATKRAKGSEKATQAVKEETTANEALTQAIQKKNTEASRPANVDSFDKIAQAQQQVVQGSSKVVTSQKQVEQAMTESAKGVDNYAKSAEKAFQQQTRLYLARTNKIPTDQYDLAFTKLERLQSILADTRMRGVLSPQQIASAESEVRRLESALRSVNQEQSHSVQTSNALGEANRERARREAEAFLALDRERAQQEAKRREDLIKTAQTAQVTYQEMIKGIHADLGVQEGIDPAKYRALAEAMNQMNRAYYSMDEAGRESAIGRALKQDLETAKQAMDLLQAYRNVMRKTKSDSSSNIEITRGDSLDSLRNKLSSLTEQYKKLTVAEIDAGKDKQIVEKFQQVSRAAEILNRRMSAPRSFSTIMGLKTDTLDDIAYKIRQLQAYKQYGIELFRPNASQEIRQVDNAIKELQKDLDKYTVTSKTANQATNALTRSMNYMKNRLAFYFTVGAMTGFVKNLIEIRSQYEMNERALGILIDSAERGSQIFQELSNMALVSPYTLIELSSAAKQLVAYDVAARDVVDTTRRLADMASAVGVPMERLTYALGQIKAYGYLNSRDNRMFANAGINLTKQLADHYTELEGRLVSTADVYDRIKKHAVDYNDVMAVMYKMTDEGGKFFDFQAKMADTLKVRLANLTLAWNNMLNDIGSQTQGTLTFAIGALKELFLHWKELDKLLTNVAWAIGLRTAFLSLIFVVNRACVAMGAFTERMALAEVFGKKLAAVVRTVGYSLWSLASSPITWALILATAMVEATNAIWGANEAQKELNKSIREGAKSNAENIERFLEQYDKLRESLYRKEGDALTPIDIDNNEAKKAWEAMREQIELTTKESGVYIGSLLSIENVSERLRQGFVLLDDLQAVNAALKELDDNTIKITQDQSQWWNAWLLPDGLIENLGDVNDVLSRIYDGYGSLENARAQAKDAEENSLVSTNAMKIVEEYDNEVKTLQEDVKKTTDSIINLIELKGWSGNANKVQEAFSQILGKIAQDNTLDPSKAFQLQLQTEEARGQAILQAYQKQLKDIQEARALANDDMEKEELRQRYNTIEQEYNFFVQTTSEERTHWSAFTKMIKDEHLYEMTQMFRGLSAEQIKQLDFTQGKYFDWVDRMARQYAKEHNMSYKDVFDTLKHYIKNANQWSIFIPLTIGTEDKKSEYDTLTELDKQADEAYQKIQRLTTRRNELKKQGAIDALSTREIDQEYKTTLDELATAQKDYNEAVAKGGHSKKEDAKNKKKNKKEKDETLESLKQEIDLVKKVQSEYDKLTKSGASAGEASATISKAFGKTLNYLNTKLRGYGLEEVDLSKIVGLDPNKQLEFFKRLRDNLSSKGLGNLERLKAVEAVINELTVTAKTYNLDKITKGLNSELDKLKDEYELSLELDANPVLGSIFEQLFDIDPSQLPRTIREYSDKVTDALNNKLNEAEQDFNVTDLLGMSRESMDEIVNALPKDSVWRDVIEKLWKEVHDANEKAVTDAAKEWNKLIEKYGTLQDKLVRISKEGAQARFNVIKQFGSEEEIAASKTLLDNIMKEQDPQKIASMIGEMMVRVNAIIARNPNAKVVIDATVKQSSKEISKAHWDDFKDSELYSMTFEDMAKTSTRAINLIVDRLDSLKDKVKEDPASMKALMDSLNKAQDELVNRNPLKAFVQSFGELSNARKEVKTATKKLADANAKVVSLENERQEYASAGNKEKELETIQKLTEARKKQNQAQVNLAGAENKETLAKKKMVSSLEATQQAMEATQGAFNALSNAFRAFGDEDTADMLGEIANGFAMIIPIVVAVAVAIKTLESTSVILLAISAALATIIGMVSWLSGREDKKILKKIEESENAVKSLENAYKSLTYAVEDSFGTIVMGFRQAQKANKEYQLVELKRQLQLERSRSSKNRDEDKINDLRSQIIELEHEIAKATEETLNDIMGISSLGEFFQGLVDDMIEAFKNGEDGMKKFAESWDEMVDTMVGKLLLQKVFTPFINAMSEDMQNIIEKYTKDSSKEKATLTQHINNLRGMTGEQVLAHYFQYNMDELEDTLVAMGKEVPEWLSERNWSKNAGQDRLKWQANVDLNAIKEAYIARIESGVTSLDEAIAYQTADATEELIEYAKQKKEEAKGIFSTELMDLLKEYYTYGQDNEKELSALQQGLNSMSESTAEALEAYMSIIAQRVFEHGNILVEIRDAVVSLDLDLQSGLMSQMLLEMQQSRQVQLAIQSILSGWSTPSGSAVKVELIS